jgi:predicted nucleic acid-binding protein
MTRRMRRPWEEVERFLSVIRVRFPTAAPLAAALEAGCKTLTSEDFQHGRRLGDCTVVNPFHEIEGR